LAKVIEEAGEGESKKVLIEYLKCKKRAWVAVESLVQGPLVKLDCGTPAGETSKVALHRERNLE
jgi:hypothetical protein